MSEPESVQSYSCLHCASTRAETIQDEVRDFEYGAPGVYRWQRCSECELVRLDPFPSPEVLGLAYPADYHAYARSKSRVTALLIRWSHRRGARAIAARLRDGGSVLDVGCSTGELLAAVDSDGRRFRRFGVEYKREAAAEARARGIDVWEGDFADAAIPFDTMDLVVMNHVLEHVFDPVATLRKISSVLKVGGTVIGELPNLRSWDAALFGRYWGGGHAPRHLWHFTPRTLRAVIDGAGLQTVAVRSSLHTGHWALSFQNFFRRGKMDTQGLRSGRAWYYPFFLLATIPINLVQFVLGRTGVMRFEARKIT